MSFAINLLLSRHDGSFKIAWITATRGISHVNKKDIVDCKVIKICDQLSQIIINNLGNTHYHCSLSCIARLINGIVKIHKRKVELILAEIIHFLVQVRRPCVIALEKDEDELRDTPATPIIKVRQKRKRQEDLLDLAVPQMLDYVENDVEITDEQLFGNSINVAPQELITLRDDIPCFSRTDNQNDFEDFGREDIGLFEMSVDIEPMPYTSPPPLPETDIIIPSPDLPSPVTHTKSPGIQPVEIKRIQQSQNTEGDNEGPSIKRVRFVRSQAFFNSVNVKNKRRNFVHINRYDSETDYYQYQWWNSETSTEVHLIDITPGAISIEIPSVFVNGRVQQGLLNETRRLQAGNSNASLSSNDAPDSSTHTRIPSAYNTIVVQAQVHDPPASDTSSMSETSVRMDTSLLNPTFHENTIAELPNISHSNEMILEHNSPPLKSTFEEVDKIEERTRLKRIKQKIINWNEQFEGDLVIDNICTPNLKRSNIAVTFNDLLSLHKMGIVTLNNKPNTLELGIILKGPKLLVK